ncbi:efflux RND transporter periplasmic adaptor subunit [Sansalvadorimonas sp. 2012CJ34-2]|uniref:Efflux RND transporter periplasmic adaptor subunit n=1 Tax=Parendozoicomonas callyspongiae TaxID=2942213 RepID=A0ABT0PLB5_9GAMM|nr:efflux RND transporter periplasmic adaptor subunit [Sansalvadorimonas sp. 2012CJ34-2]MCL6272138.1 efflux RND transporter periplasmic adaptor subunit [Sansalvadorimonas sp. 2012CJ34-2]
MPTRYFQIAARAGLFVTVTLGLLLGCSKQEEIAKEVVRPVKLFEIKDTNGGDVRRFPAQVYSAEESKISFRIPGELIALPVKTAEEVSKGQLLARLDDRDIRNELDLRQADYDLTEINHKRIKSLREKKVVSQAELDTASTNLKSARASLKLAKDKLEYSTLTAPFDGRVARVDVENYQFVMNQQTILILQDSKTLKVNIQMPENILANVQREHVDEGYQPTVTFSGIPNRTFLVSYKEHSTTVTPGTQSYKVTFTMPVPEDIIVYPGMGATVAIDFVQLMNHEGSAPSVVVPLTAILEDDVTGQQQAWIYDPETGAVKPVLVAVGQVTREGIKVVSGLKQGDMVVTAGLTRLRSGMKVKPLTRERGL